MAPSSSLLFGSEYPSSAFIASPANSCWALVKDGDALISLAAAELLDDGLMLDDDDDEEGEEEVEEEEELLLEVVVLSSSELAMLISRRAE